MLIAAGCQETMQHLLWEREKIRKKLNQGPKVLFQPRPKGTLASLMAQVVKNLPAMQETQVRSLGLEDPLDKEMATHSNILAWEIPWIEEPGELQPMGCQELDTA